MPHTTQESNHQRYRRPDTYRAAARLIGCSVAHIYDVLHGNRETTATNRIILQTWAEKQVAAGHKDSPAVRAALANIAA